MLCLTYLHRHPSEVKISATELAELSAYHVMKLEAQNA